MILAENLSMFYGPVNALDSVSFEIKKGEVIGLLGPNGAGKSTTLKILTTYIYPTYGTAYVDGKDVCKDPIHIRKMIGYLPEQLPLYMDMEVGEYLSFIGNSRGLYGFNLKQRLDWVVEKCGLKVMYRKAIRELSKGFKQRTALAQALIHNPEIIILDEPTSGLDPHQILEIRGLIRELAQEKTIIFSTHILQEIEAVTDRIIIVNKGNIVANGTIPEIQKQAIKSESICLVLDKSHDSDEITTTLNSCENISNVTHTSNENKVSYHIEAVPGKNTLNIVANIIKEKSWNFYELKENPFSLEEIFLTLTKKETKGDES